MTQRPSTGIIWPTHKAKARTRRRLRKDRTRNEHTPGAINDFQR